MHVDFGAHRVKTVTGWQWICLGSEGVKSMQTLSRKGDPENCTIIHRLLKRQSMSPQTVLLRTTLTRTIVIY